MSTNISPLILSNGWQLHFTVSVLSSQPVLPSVTSPTCPEEITNDSRKKNCISLSSKRPCFAYAQLESIFFNGVPRICIVSRHPLQRHLSESGPLNGFAFLYSLVNVGGRQVNLNGKSFWYDSHQSQPCVMKSLIKHLISARHVWLSMFRSRGHG